MLAAKHTGNATHDRTGYTSLLLMRAGGGSAVVVLRSGGLLGLRMSGRHETRCELSDELPGRVLAPSAATPFTTTQTSAEELAREPAEVSKRARTLTAATVAGVLAAAEECIHRHALWYKLSARCSNFKRTMQNPSLQDTTHP